ncbi:uncharacterized protein K444DRAFT_260390 [Hyaloscypha bicolor E]|uniref:Uncharacterized protein n=1 Tax=Hyaloscypha bicolor E TaxID=1095630 RepID=A0A2J6SHC2_9HELO|nr:uncharacterized protein K444DRAFT_260390 [Hyaloscypha bicolor E]PMD50159.1 hypothetical protein K444DRAFT_260390 [Hyaloscypha bicolor E]
MRNMDQNPLHPVSIRLWRPPRLHHPTPPYFQTHPFKRSTLLVFLDSDRCSLATCSTALLSFSAIMLLLRILACLSLSGHPRSSHNRMAREHRSESRNTKRVERLKGWVWK